MLEQLRHRRDSLKPLIWPLTRNMEFKIKSFLTRWTPEDLERGNFRKRRIFRRPRRQNLVGRVVDAEDRHRCPRWTDHFVEKRHRTGTKQLFNT